MSRGTIDFVKMHGAGNDFIMIDDMSERFDPNPETIAALCTVHRGIGADGLILLRPASRGSFSMKYHNSDGGEAAMCGNGARCAALFAFERGIARRTMVFETGSGLVHAEVLGDRVSVGIEEVKDLRLHIDLPLAGVTVHFASAGVPHAIVLDEDARGYDPERFLALARSIRHDPAFQPAGTNVNLVTVHGPDRLTYRTYERGVEGETLACGTGAVATAVVTAHIDLTEPPVTCETSGGDLLDVFFEKNSDGGRNCRLVGPAVATFTGSFHLEHYHIR
jgi:diaminopimelate epimerase